MNFLNATKKYMNRGILGCFVILCIFFLFSQTIFAQELPPPPKDLPIGVVNPQHLSQPIVTVDLPESEKDDLRLNTLCPAGSENCYFLLEPLPVSDSTLPGVVNGELTYVGEDMSLGDWVNIMFKIAIGILTVLAVVMIMAGGIQYMTTDSVTGHSEGINRMTGAIFGLLIALATFVVLNTINPNLLTFPSLKPAVLSVLDDPEEALYDATTGSYAYSQCKGGKAPNTNDTCPTCVNLADYIPASYIGSTGKQVSKATAEKLQKLYNEKRIIIANTSGGGTSIYTWQVTEAYPPSTPIHCNQCHYNGTCVDLAFRPQSSGAKADVLAQPIFSFITAAVSAGLTAQFEAPGSDSNTERCIELDKAVSEKTGSADSVKCFKHVTGEHFSIYDPAP